MSLAIQPVSTARTAAFEKALSQALSHRTAAADPAAAAGFCLFCLAVPTTR
ncbi:hypothetical protein AB2L27_18165 [Kineococcus sp. LSe6-4]|uniref:Uncharacterized protein n=1 Tax=Kineococcus halophytocola TaxID=3234027 RepID=A0ABV4H7B4_9ACTN